VRSLLHVLLVFALGLVLSGAAHAWAPAACAADCAEEGLAGEGAEDGCADDAGLPCGPQCLACLCGAPAWALPAHVAPPVSFSTSPTPGLPAAPLGRAEDGVVRGVFQPPRAG
jgi:hypothetical protein